MKKIFINASIMHIIIVVLFTQLSINAQDSRERIYLYPNLKPQHHSKPLIQGWANERIEDKINRGLIAVPGAKGQVYLSWRLLKTDPEGTEFNVYRSVNNSKETLLNKKPISITTDYTDHETVNGTPASYWIRTIVDGKVMESSEKVSVQPGQHEGPFLYSFKFQGDYRPQRIAVADLNGDGSYDYILKQPAQGIDPAGQPDTSGLTYKIEAYLNDGTFLWCNDLGPGIEPGIWYSPIIAYDFDGDGKSEIAVKTGPEDARGANGRVVSGPEWCSILNGMTGEEITKVNWPARNPRFGDYNRNNRNQLGIAYLDGKTPSLLIARGTYKLMVVDAYQFHNGVLEQLWHWDSDEENPVIRSQGAHGMHTADVDEDGRDEIVLGSVVLDDNGTALYSVGLGHPDKCFVTDIDPSHPGMEIFYAIEPWHDDGNGVCMVDARTGEIIWSINQKTLHVGNGMVADIDPALPGLECFATEDSKGGSSDRYLFTADGNKIGSKEDVPDCGNWIYWDDDLVRETFNFERPARDPGQPRSSNWRNYNPKNSVVKYKGDTLCRGIEGRIIMIADLAGDWREEVVTVLSGELRIYTTNIPAKDKRICLMQDPVYRAEVAHRSMGYEQSPVTSYYLGVSPSESANKEPLIGKEISRTEK